MNVFQFKNNTFRAIFNRQTLIRSTQIVGSVKRNYQCQGLPHPQTALFMSALFAYHGGLLFSLAE
jgi:hypothetical protein